MKSLEIVNYKISLFEKDKQGFTALSWFQLNDIKQDLEVLEIITNKNVSLKDLKLYIQGFVEGGFETIEVVLWSYNLIRKEEQQLTLEELLKLKQWLEVNEYGTKCYI